MPRLSELKLSRSLEAHESEWLSAKLELNSVEVETQRSGQPP